MIAKLLELLYYKVLINIIVSSKKTVIYIDVVSNAKSVKTAKKEFHSTTLTSEMVSFIHQYSAESPFFYIALLDNSNDQGALPTCSRTKYGYYGVDEASYESICMQKTWSCYTSREDIYEVEKVYAEVGLDFIFSPFIVLSHIYKDKMGSNLAMYILVEDGYLSLSIYEEGILLFAQHLDLEHSKDEQDMLLDEEVQDDELLLDDGDDLSLDDSLDDELDILDDLGDIEDLDSLDDIDEFATTADMEEELLQEEEELNTQEEEKEEEISGGEFNEDYQRFGLIQSSLKEFYSDERYDSEFIEFVYIADGIGVSKDLKHYLEEEMFLTVYIRKVELHSLLNEVMKKELGIIK